MPRLLIVAGIALIVVGVLWWAGERLGIGLGRLPGDFRFESGNTRIYIPLASCLLISVILSLIFWIIGR